MECMRSSDGGFLRCGDVGRTGEGILGAKVWEIWKKGRTREDEVSDGPDVSCALRERKRTRETRGYATMPQLHKCRLV